jgi:hypothetical protein
MDQRSRPCLLPIHHPTQIGGAMDNMAAPWPELPNPLSSSLNSNLKVSTDSSNGGVSLRKILPDDWSRGEPVHGVGTMTRGWGEVHESGCPVGSNGWCTADKAGPPVGAGARAVVGARRWAAQRKEEWARSQGLGPSAVFPFSFFYLFCFLLPFCF